MKQGCKRRKEKRRENGGGRKDESRVEEAKGDKKGLKGKEEKMN